MMFAIDWPHGVDGWLLTAASAVTILSILLGAAIATARRFIVMRVQSVFDDALKEGKIASKADVDAIKSKIDNGLTSRVVRVEETTSATQVQVAQIHGWLQPPDGVNRRATDT